MRFLRVDNSFITHIAHEADPSDDSAGTLTIIFAAHQKESAIADNLPAAGSSHAKSGGDWTCAACGHAAANHVHAPTRRARAYHYLDFSRERFEDFAEALSPATHFRTSVRDTFEYEECGFARLSDTLHLAIERDGFTHLWPSERANKALMLAEVLDSDPDATYDTDDDCNGDHIWVLGPDQYDDRDGHPRRAIWHLNLANNLVVPPTPRLIEKRDAA